MKRTYLVGNEKGSYKRIQEAIDDAKNDSIIKISPGVYKENLVIVNKSLKLERKDISSEIYILGENEPALTVDVSESHSVLIEGISFAHKGDSSERVFPSEPIKAIKASPVTTPTPKQLDEVSKAFKNLKELKETEGVNTCIIHLKNGSLNVRSSTFNLNLILRMVSKERTAYGILAEAGASIIVSDCELRGSNIFKSQAVQSIKANIIMKDCIVSQFKSGGIFAMIGHSNRVNIISSRVTFNHSFGIKIMGCSTSYQARKAGNKKALEVEDTIEFCDIERNSGAGLILLTPTNINVTRNNIYRNVIGVHIVSADPVLRFNSIKENLEEGIFVEAIKGFPAIPIIKSNSICSNGNSGIYCKGEGNLSRIVLNKEIFYNQLSGIKVEHLARPFIKSNRICRNLFQGVVLVDNSSAYIERNYIAENIKANIAFGGRGSADTVIIKNTITKGRCEGIFMIEGGTAVIKDNKIVQNYEGVRLITSCPQLIKNKISDNLKAGLVLMKDSRPVVTLNSFLANQKVGIMVRDNSDGRFQDNRIFGSDVALIVEASVLKGQKIKEDNLIEDGECRVPYSVAKEYCTLI